MAPGAEAKVKIVLNYNKGLKRRISKVAEYSLYIILTRFSITIASREKEEDKIENNEKSNIRIFVRGFRGSLNSFLMSVLL